MVRIFLVDDHEVVRRGIAGILAGQDGFAVVGEASTCQEAMAGIPVVAPDVVVLDVHLPDGSGIDLCRQIRTEHPRTQCLILTAYDDDDALVAAVLGGAAGYLLKNVRTLELIAAIRSLSEGRTLLSNALVRQVSQRMDDAPVDDPRFGSLNEREKQILALIADGMTNRQIGETLSLAEKTVKNYVSSLLNKLGLERRTQAAILHVENNRDASPHSR
ncbi:response regulator transcription factor [Microbacterium sp. LWO12-1.2]|uniref:response regulator transcription factor n=1 Tax=Microbacterium sp. LWO12-1.2 TaxID=3135261 RepID=UPI00341EFF22